MRWAKGDFDGAVEFFDREVAFVIRPEFPDAGTYVGAEEIAAYTRGFLDPWVQVTIEAEETIIAGDSVLVAVRQRGAGDSSGVATEMRYFTLWSFRGGRVVRFENLRERADALEAAGLSD
jgi:ketosteroid isomerase-like protein